MVFVSGLSGPEGPVLLADGSLLVVEMGAGRGCVTQISPDGSETRVVAKTGQPNGLAIGRDGTVWVAESSVPSLLRVTLDGNIETFATGYDGEPFLFPNDLAFGPDGALYMTDSGNPALVFAPDGEARADWAQARPDSRVYRIDTRTGWVRKLDAGIRFANGIAFGPDDNLYVNETITGVVYRYHWRSSGDVGAREDFGNVVDPTLPRGFRGPDGMKFGADGNLYVAVYGQQDVTVLAPNGAVIKRLRTEGRGPTNLVFGLPGTRRIYVTEYERGTIEVLEVDTDGLPLHMG